MTSRPCFLYTATEGPSHGDTCLVLHDRYQNLAAAQASGQRLGEACRRIAVRSLRDQTIGGSGNLYGHFWFIGPPDKPELSTLFDGLEQLEALLLQVTAERPGQPLTVLATGESTVMAALLAMTWPDRINRLILEDAHLPVNLSDIPLERKSLSGCQVTLVAETEAQATAFRDLGAEVRVIAAL